MKVHLVGGFLGAGKTTLIRALARHLTAGGEKVAVITNDQGRALVDTQLCRAEVPDVTEITGGCFCCRYDELESALVAARRRGATVALAEAVGSCTDLIATVWSPLTQTHTDAEKGFHLAPLAIVVDPWRVRQVAAGGVHDDVAYLFRKQIQEADVILTTRAELNPPDVHQEMRALAPDAVIVSVSGQTGQGITEWLQARPQRPAAPLEIDYERYGAAEGLLGWSNGVVHLTRSTPFSPARVMADFLSALSDTPVAHVKLVWIAATVGDGSGGSGSLVRHDSAPVLDTKGLPAEVTRASFVINARIAIPPSELEPRLRQAMKDAFPGGTPEWEQWECFRPSPPTPTHRHSFRCGTGDDASCCAAFYDRTAVRYLLGDSLHPGGIDLTLRMAQHLRLREGHKILDVACGQATSLRAVSLAWPVEPVGLDAGTIEQASASTTSGEIDFHQGDAHDIPFQAGHFDAVLCECALSTFFDPPRALREMRRVLKKGGRLALSDMVVEGDIPEELEEWVHVGTCLAGALGFDGYERVLTEAGFRIVERWDASEELEEMIGRIKRNLLGLALAKASGHLPNDVNIDVREGRKLLRTAGRAVSEGVIGYGVYIAERVD